MRIVLKILFTGLLLLLAVALGTEVAALHRAQGPAPGQTAPPVVVRKAAHATTPPKTVRPLRLHEHPAIHKANPLRPKVPVG